jgi:hypothetical protein
MSSLPQSCTSTSPFTAPEEIVELIVDPFLSGEAVPDIKKLQAKKRAGHFADFSKYPHFEVPKPLITSLVFSPDGSQLLFGLSSAIDSAVVAIDISDAGNNPPPLKTPYLTSAVPLYHLREVSTDVRIDVFYRYSAILTENDLPVAVNPFTLKNGFDLSVIMVGREPPFIFSYDDAFKAFPAATIVPQKMTHCSFGSSPDIVPIVVRGIYPTFIVIQFIAGKVEISVDKIY